MLSYGALLLARLDRKYDIHLPMLTADIKESKAGHLTLPPLPSPSLGCESQISLLGAKNPFGHFNFSVQRFGDFRKEGRPPKLCSNI